MLFTLTVTVDEYQVKLMKERGHSLFLAKLIQGQDKANVIWKSDSAFIYSNTFQWQPVYAIAGTETFKEPGILVEASTAVKPIEHGQSIEIDEYGNMTNASGPVAPGEAFKLTNRDFNNKLSGAVYARAADRTKPGADPTPFFISKVLEKDCNFVDILPMETVVLWFGPAQEAGTIIADYSGQTCTVAYGVGESKHTVEWTKEGIWKMVD